MIDKVDFGMLFLKLRAEKQIGPKILNSILTKRARFRSEGNVFVSRQTIKAELFIYASFFTRKHYSI